MIITHSLAAVAAGTLGVHPYPGVAYPHPEGAYLNTPEDQNLQQYKAYSINTPSLHEKAL